jgi:hypothetical protein
MSENDTTAYLILAPLVVVGDGSAATYLYRGGIIPAGFATEAQIEHHLAIKAIEPIDLPVAEGEIIETDGETIATDPTEPLDGKSFDDWRLDDLKALAKTGEISLTGITAKADVYRAILAAREAARQ